MFKYSKDAVSILTILDSRRPKADGKYPVKVQIIYQRTQRYYPTGKTLTPEEWEKLPTTKTRSLVAIRESIENSFNIVRGQVESMVFGGDFSFDVLNQRLKKGSSSTVNTAFRVKIEALKADDMVGNSMIYDTVIKGLERFAGGNIAYHTITTDWLNRYEKFLLTEKKSYSTIGIHMRTLRAILNDAKRIGIIKESAYPFGRDKYEVKASEGRKMALSLEQIGQIVRYDDGSAATAKYRDYWLFLYLCNGINMADFVKLKYANIEDGEIYFVRQKTERTNRMRREIRAIVTPEMQAIIDRWGNPPVPDSYIFPVLKGDEDAMTVKKKTQYTTRAINKRMAEIGKQLGVSHISTYTARHSYATVLKRSGANIAYISESLGHSSLQTTETYLASFEKEERQKNAALLTNFK
jgi:integrase